MTKQKQVKLSDIFEAANGRVALAKHLKITRHAIYQWDKVPVSRVNQVSRLTGFRPDQIRPDIFKAIVS
jgi:hypothetical protein